MSAYLSREAVLQAEGFVGRQADLAWVGDMLRRPSPQNCNITGEPRIGKTSFLYQVVVRRSGLRPEQKGLYIWLRLAELPDHRPTSFWREMLLRLGQAQRAAGWAVSQEQAGPDDDRAIFDTLDEQIEELLTETDCQRLFFLIDDFDLLLRGISSRDLDWLRSLATRYSENVAFVISSNDSLVTLTEKLLQREGMETAVSPFANMFHNRPLALLTLAEAEQLCQETAVAERQSPLTATALEFLQHEAGRHPALLKIACSYLFEARQYALDDEIFQDVASDMRLDEHVNWLFRQLWQRRNPVEQAVLSSLTQSAKPEPDPILLNRLKKHLGLVESRAGKLALFADAVASWLGRELGKSGEEVWRRVSTDELTYLPDKRLVYLDDREVSLTALEGRLLAYLLAHQNEVCTAVDLLENVWGAGKTPSVVEKGVNRLRLKIERDPKRPRFILSARGEGYMLRKE
jgi:hypothetical protein